MVRWTCIAAAVALLSTQVGSRTTPVRRFAPGVTLPLFFERNEGQAIDEIRFLAHTGHTSLLLAQTGVWIRPASIWLKLNGANPSPQIQPVDPLPGTIN